MSSPQHYYDDEFRAMMEGLEFQEPHRWYKAMAWVKPIGVALLTLAALLVCTILGGPALYIAPVLFLGGVLLLAKTMPRERAQQDLRRLTGKSG